MTLEHWGDDYWWTPEEIAEGAWIDKRAREHFYVNEPMKDFDSAPWAERNKYVQLAWEEYKETRL